MLTATYLAIYIALGYEVHFLMVFKHFKRFPCLTKITSNDTKKQFSEHSHLYLLPEVKGQNPVLKSLDLHPKQYGSCSLYALERSSFFKLKCAFEKELKALYMHLAPIHQLSSSRNSIWKVVTH